MKKYAEVLYMLKKAAPDWRSNLSKIPGMNSPASAVQPSYPQGNQNPPAGNGMLASPGSQPAQQMQPPAANPGGFGDATLDAQPNTNKPAFLNEASAKTAVGAQSVPSGYMRINGQLVKQRSNFNVQPYSQPAAPGSTPRNGRGTPYALRNNRFATYNQTGKHYSINNRTGVASTYL